MLSCYFNLTLPSLLQTRVHGEKFKLFNAASNNDSCTCRDMSICRSKQCIAISLREWRRAVAGYPGESASADANMKICVNVCFPRRGDNADVRNIKQLGRRYQHCLQLN